MLVLAFCPLALLAQQAPEPPRTSASGTTAVSGTAASNADEQVYVLDEFRVEGKTDASNIKTDETLGAMRINTRLIDSPISVSVLPAQFINDFMLEEVGDQLSYIAGGNLAIEPQSGTGGYEYLRGFKPAYYRNGFRSLGIAETVNLERVEFIKGPLAATFGLAEPGGLVNYITQRPLRKYNISLKANYGSYDYQRYEAHVNTGPIVSNKLFGRVDVSYVDKDGFQDFTWLKRFAMSAALTWQPTPDTTVNVEFERLRMAQNRGDTGIRMSLGAGTFTNPFTGAPSVGTIVGGIYDLLEKAGFNQLGPNFIQTRVNATADLRIEHRINSFMSLRANFQYWSRPYEEWIYAPGSATSAEAGGYYYITSSAQRFGSSGNPRTPYHENDKSTSKLGQVDLTTAFNLGPTAHKLLATCDFSDNSSHNMGYHMDASVPSPVPFIYPENPDWTDFDRSLLTVPAMDQSLKRTILGYLLSDRMAVGKWALLFASIRYDHLITQYADTIQWNMSGDKNNIEKSYSLGGNLKINGDKLAFFGNVSSSYQLSTVVDLGTGELQDDVHATGYEAGFKGEMLDGKAYWTLSAYRIDRKNVPQTNQDFSVNGGNPAGMAEYIGTGWERSNGLELEVYADINPEWSLMLAGSYMHAFTVVPAPTDPARAGVPLSREPRRAGSATVTRSFKSGPLSHLKIGASARYTDSYVAEFGLAGSQVAGANATAANNYGITRNIVINYGNATHIEEVRPAAQLYDMYVSYWFNMGRYRHIVNFSVKNLFDKEWYSASGRLCDGRTFYLSYTVKY